MKYDDATWHHDFAHSEVACYTHIGFYFAWAVEKGLTVELTINETEATRKRLKARTIMPGYYARWIDLDKLTHNELNEMGNAFSTFYYDQNGYLSDYEDCFLLSGSSEEKRRGKGWQYVDIPKRRRKFRKQPVYASFYEVTDDWKNFDRINVKLDQRFRDWQKSKDRKTVT